MNYNEFLHSKVEVAPVSGFTVRPEDVNSALKPHQRDAVIWACKGGRRALFESFGLGKTAQELEWWGVKCYDCGAEKVSKQYDLPTDAMDAWNRREYE